MSDGVECDFSLILSQELIAEVMEEYLNRKMLKQGVEVVDLQNTEAGYIFYLKKKVEVTKVNKDVVYGMTLPNQVGKSDVYDVYVGGSGSSEPKHVGRAKNGKFVSNKELSHG